MSERSARTSRRARRASAGRDRASRRAARRAHHRARRARRPQAPARHPPASAHPAAPEQSKRVRRSGTAEDARGHATPRAARPGAHTARPAIARPPPPRRRRLASSRRRPEPHYVEQLLHGVRLPYWRRARARPTTGRRSSRCGHDSSGFGPCRLIADARGSSPPAARPLATPGGDRAPPSSRADDAAVNRVAVTWRSNPRRKGST